jgi:predicted phosphodiesterase
MRVALLSDIHGNLPALEAVAADIRRRGVDEVLCLGDNVSGPLLPLETAQFLMNSGWTILAGNHERQVLAYDSRGGGASDAYARSQLTASELQWMRSLTHTATVHSDIFVCHGTPRSDCEHFLETPRDGLLSLAQRADVLDRLGSVQASLVACGHSHVPRSVRLTSGQLIVNPGSVGLQAYADDHPEPYVMQRGTPDAHYAIAERSAGGWIAAHFAVRYNVKAVAELARRAGQKAWESALLHGYLGDA